MTNQHPITPPPELTDKWNNLPLSTEEIFVIAAQWGADQELEACKQVILHQGWFASGHRVAELTAARRPKPLSLKEQALSELNLTADPDGAELSRTQVELIRCALEALDD